MAELTHPYLQGCYASLLSRVRDRSSLGFLERCNWDHHDIAYDKAARYIASIDAGSPFARFSFSDEEIRHGDYSIHIKEVIAVQKDIRNHSTTCQMSGPNGHYTKVNIEVSEFVYEIKSESGEHSASFFFPESCLQGRLPDLLVDLFETFSTIEESLAHILFERITRNEYVTIHDVDFELKGMSFTTGSLFWKKPVRLNYRDALIKAANHNFTKTVMESASDVSIKKKIKHDRWNGSVVCPLLYLCKDNAISDKSTSDVRLKPADRLSQLKELRDTDLISEEEYANRKQDILNSI